MQRLGVSPRSDDDLRTSWLGKLAKSNSLNLKSTHTARSISKERQVDQPGSRYDLGTDPGPWPLDQVNTTERRGLQRCDPVRALFIHYIAIDDGARTHIV